MLAARQGRSMARSTRSSQLQIRVTPSEKAAIGAAARAAGLKMSAWVLAAVLPASTSRFQALVRDCEESSPDFRFALAELNSFLASLSRAELRDAVRSLADVPGSPMAANYVAAMVELACARRRLSPPSWTARVPPLDRPWFGSQLLSARLHLLTRSPAPFRHRNIFVDSSVGDRV
jgi:uncharacterized protein (DUF1778 family)